MTPLNTTNATKSTGMFMSHRNLDHSQSPGMPFEVQLCGSYDPEKCGPVEFSYSRVNRTAPNVTAITVFFDANSTAFGGGAEQYPVYSYRNNLSRTPSTESFDVTDDPFDGNMDLTGADRATYLGRYGAESAGVLTE